MKTFSYWRTAQTETHSTGDSPFVFTSRRPTKPKHLWERVISIFRTKVLYWKKFRFVSLSLFYWAIFQLWKVCNWKSYQFFSLCSDFGSSEIPKKCFMLWIFANFTNHFSPEQLTWFLAFRPKSKNFRFWQPFRIETDWICSMDQISESPKIPEKPIISIRVFFQSQSSPYLHAWYLSPRSLFWNVCVVRRIWIKNYRFLLWVGILLVQTCRKCFRIRFMTIFTQLYLEKYWTSKS